MSKNKQISQIAISTIKSGYKQDIYPVTTDKAVYTTDREGNDTTLDKVNIKGIKVNGEFIPLDTTGVVNIVIPAITSVDTVESTLDGGTNVVTIYMSDEQNYSFDVKNGRSAYQSYLDTTLDSPKKTESEWIASLKGDQGNSGYSGAAEELEVVNNLESESEISALSAKMGKILNEKANTIKDTNSSDFAISDNNGFAIFTISNGHIKTKNFDSIKVPLAVVTEHTLIL